MKLEHLAVLLPLVLLPACATLPQKPESQTVVPKTAGPSHVSVLVPGEGYSGDCFSGFFRPEQEHTAERQVAWIFVDPGDETADIRFDNRYVQLTRTAMEYDEKAGHGVAAYFASAPKLWVGLDFVKAGSDGGTDHYKGTLEVKADGMHETIRVKGVSVCVGD